MKAVRWGVTFWVNHKTNARKEDASADSMEDENKRKQVDWLEERIAQMEDVARQADSVSRENERLRKLLKAAMWGMLVIIWIYQAYIQGNNAICPYTSEILHIGRETFF